MELYNYLLLLLFVKSAQLSIYTSLKDNVFLLLKRSLGNTDGKNRWIDADYDVTSAKEKAGVIKKARTMEARLNRIDIPSSKDHSQGGKDRYHRDPVLNVVRRAIESRRPKYALSDSLSTSSSAEQRNWKEEWEELWLKKKYEAINSTVVRGDTVNMVAARPWGVPCGDPNQHDFPWGTCMLPIECDVEYRIYRGDYFCGRTHFVCCALQHTTYDQYEGIDVSFADSSFSTDSQEKFRDDSKEQKRKKRRRDRNRRKRDRKNRKRAIKRTIRRIIREMKKILNRTYRNGTTSRKRKTKQLKDFIKSLKKQYKKDRTIVKNIHVSEMITIDKALKKKLDDIKDLNVNFIKNSTFRDIVVNGSMTKQGARMLLQAYPELRSYIHERTDARRSGNFEVSSESEEEKAPKDYLEYDIEYGLLYY